MWLTTDKNDYSGHPESYKIASYEIPKNSYMWWSACLLMKYPWNASSESEKWKSLERNENP